MTTSVGTTANYWFSPEAEQSTTGSGVQVPDILSGRVYETIDGTPVPLTVQLDPTFLWDIRISFKNAAPIQFDGFAPGAGGDLLTLLTAQGWVSNGPVNNSPNSSVVTSVNGVSGAVTLTIPTVPVFDTTAADILPNGVQSAGSNGKIADSGHVHPLQSGFLPSDMNLQEWNWDSSLANSGTVVPTTSGQILLIRVPIRVARTITSVNFHMSTLGSGLTAGQNFAGLYSSTGALIGTTADLTTAWNTGGSTGFQNPALVGGPFSVGPGFCWVALMFNGTTGPTLIRCSNISTSAANLGLGPSSARYARASVTGTSLPASITPSGNVLQQLTFWAGVS